jgi:hypothetical protein
MQLKLSRAVFSWPPLGKNAPPGTKATCCSRHLLQQLAAVDVSGKVSQRNRPPSGRVKVTVSGRLRGEDPDHEVAALAVDLDDLVDVVVEAVELQVAGHLPLYQVLVCRSAPA